MYKSAKGWLSSDERDCLKSLALRTPKGAIIANIGVEYGASLVCLFTGNPSAHVVGIDVIGDDKLDPQNKAFIDGCEGVFEPIKDDSKKYRDRIDTEYDLVFVDGDHSAGGVYEDALYANKIKMGGVICFHDCNPNAIVGDSVDEGIERWLSEESKFIEIGQVDTIRIFKRVM